MMPADKFGNIYDKYVDKIYRFVFLKVNSNVIAQDLTSETFTRTFEYLTRNSDKEVENMQAFLYRTARNIVFDYYRQKSRQDVPLEYESKEMVENELQEQYLPGVALEQNERVFEIKKALQGLKGESGEILTMHYVQDLSIKEIAEITGRPEGTIRVMLHRGLKELRGLLD